MGTGEKNWKGNPLTLTLHFRPPSVDGYKLSHAIDMLAELKKHRWKNETLILSLQEKNNGYKTGKAESKFFLNSSNIEPMSAVVCRCKKTMGIRVSIKLAKEKKILFFP
jgi:hypothetical protein